MHYFPEKFAINNPLNHQFPADVLEKSSLLHDSVSMIQPKIHVEQMISPSLPPGKRSLLKSWMERVIDGNPSFNDQTELTSQITQVAESDTPPTINGRDSDARSKREVSRRKRDCDLSAKQCEALLQTVQNYLMALKLSMTSDDKVLSADILKCLECKQLMTDKNDEDHTPESKDRYFTHNYDEENRSSDFGPAVIKLQDDEEVESGSKRTEVNRTEEAPVEPVMTDSVMNYPSQDTTNQSLNGTSISETTITLIVQIPMEVNGYTICKRR